VKEIVEIDESFSFVKKRVNQHLNELNVMRKIINTGENPYNNSKIPIII